jgi:CheY-like chemotaxis protein
MEPQKHILIVEDDAFLGDVLVQKFSGAGFNVKLTRDGAEGLAALGAVRPDIILLDLLMPRMDGHEFLERKNADRALADIPVLVISNLGQPNEIERALRLGAKDYIIKSEFDPDEVVEKVEAYLSGNVTAGGAARRFRPGTKVVVVEDDKLLSDLLAKRLASEGCVFYHAIDRVEALSIIRDTRPDIVVLDILLPDADGFEILRTIKADPETASVPILLLSNLGQDKDIEKGKQLGAENYLVKAAVTLDDIMREIRRILDARVGGARG